MNNDMNTNEIRQLLNRSAGQLDPHIVDSLRLARERAMQRHNPGARGHREWTHALRHAPAAWVATLLLTVALVGGGIYYWQASDNSDIDVAILTDDLPADIYVN